jgi:hypothetical protein
MSSASTPKRGEMGMLRAAQEAQRLKPLSTSAAFPLFAGAEGNCQA